MFMWENTYTESGFSHKSTIKSRTVKTIKTKVWMKHKYKVVKRGPRQNKKTINKNIVFAGANLAGAKSKWSFGKKT